MSIQLPSQLYSRIDGRVTNYIVLIQHIIPTMATNTGGVSVQTASCTET